MQVEMLTLGDMYVGKTSLLRRFGDNVFNRGYEPTIGVDFKIKFL